MGLASLSITGHSDDGLKRIDPALCFSVEARRRVEDLRWFVEA